MTIKGLKMCENISLSIFRIFHYVQTRTVSNIAILKLYRYSVCSIWTQNFEYIWPTTLSNVDPMILVCDCIWRYDLSVHLHFFDKVSIEIEEELSRYLLLSDISAIDMKLDLSQPSKMILSTNASRRYQIDNQVIVHISEYLISLNGFCMIKGHILGTKEFISHPYKVF